MGGGPETVRPFFFGENIIRFPGEGRDPDQAMMSPRRVQI